MQDPSAKAQPPPLPKPGGRQYVLRFISGKYQGGEFPLTADKPILVGRSSDLDMVLVEDMVSRKHARIQVLEDGIWIEDLGSTNGSFVNGEKIKRARLKEGDRVLIGTSILKVMAADAARSEESAGIQEGDALASQRRTGQTRTMSGALEEVPLPDLLQLFGTSKKNGVLVLRSDDNTGHIFLRQGRIYFATINDFEDVDPLKALYRMLTWEHGFFDLDPPDERTFENEVDVAVQQVLMEGMRLLDEYNRLREDLPAMNATLSLAAPIIPPLRDLKPEELDALQLVHNYSTLTAVLNKSLGSDLDTAQIIVRLLKGGYIRAD